MIWFQSFRRKQHGQAVVEMALVLPILIMLIFGIVEFGRILNTYMIVTNLSREGAREGAVGGTDAEIISAVQLGTNANQLNAGNLTITIDPTAAGPRARGSSVGVEVSYPVDIIAPVIGNIIGDPYVVTSQTTMRVEG
ncbi:MAG: pilus assembly protein TadG [Firmicutes bacterium HGW-Firmicutes-14]|nr:MAG: pilus assembly protein TadG [Firmicutes bacterium HGW-Firmicutes-14]